MAKLSVQWKTSKIKSVNFGIVTMCVLSFVKHKGYKINIYKEEEEV